MNTPTHAQAPETTGGESATPRTDAVAVRGASTSFPRASYFVDADFARQLERETATLHAQLGEAQDKTRAAWDDASAKAMQLNEAHAQIARMKQREGELVGLLARAENALNDLLNHGTPVPHPYTGEPIPHQADPANAEQVSLSIRAALQPVAKEGEQ